MKIIPNPAVRIAAFALGAVLAATSLHATDTHTFTTTVVASDATFPNVAFSNTAAATGNVQWRINNSSAPTFRHVGQTFTVGETGFTLDKIILPVRTNNVNNAAFTLSLYELENAYVTGGVEFQAVDTIFTATSTLPSSETLPTGNFETSGSKLALSFDVKDTVLKAGRVYGFVLSFVDTGAFSAISFFTNGAFSQGSQLRIEDTTTSGYFTNSGADLMFYVTAAAVPVPEPSTYAFFAGGLALVIATLALKKRKLSNKHSRQ